LKSSQDRASLRAQLDAARARLAALQGEIRNAELNNSVQLRREQLVQVNWKAMRGPQLEAFLAVVFTELGYAVEMIGAAGDQGVDLIATRDDLRIAIQSKGYVDSVSNAAVQEVYAGMTYHRCDACAVITNSRFTSGAAELARRTNCMLVDENRLPSLIRGEIDLVRRYQFLNSQLAAAQPRQG
jgi:restriction system protein